MTNKQLILDLLSSLLDGNGNPQAVYSELQNVLRIRQPKDKQSRD